MLLPSSQPPQPIVGGIRRWVRGDMRVLRWVFLTLYGLLVGGLLLWPWVSGEGAEGAVGLLIAGAVMLAAQTLLIFGSGTISLCRPIKKRRLILPVLVAATMLALLLAGLMVAMWELFTPAWNFDDDLFGLVFFGLVAASWLAWALLLFSRLRDRPRYTVLRRLTAVIFTGSLAELLATVPSHVIVTRRPGCLVGLGTGAGIAAGLCVMFFSFGPAIAILFLRPRWRAEMQDGVPYCPACGYDLRASKHRCPECGLPFELAADDTVIR